MKNLKKFLIILALLSSTSARNSHRKNREESGAPSWLLHLEGVDSISSRKDGNEDKIPKNGGTCETRECHQIANSFLETINKSVDPCDNFYEFACGGWTPEKSIPEYEGVWSRFMLFENALENRIRGDLEEELSPRDILPVRQAKKWYRSCMDTHTRELRGIKPIESVLMQAGGWPMIMDTAEWNGEELTWQEIDDYYVRLMGTHTFYEISPNDDKISIARGNLPLEMFYSVRDRNYTTEGVATYRNIIKRVANLFIEQNVADISEERLENDIDDLLEFEEKIYMAMWEASKMSSNVKLPNPDGMTLDEFVEWWREHTESRNNTPQIDWRHIIQQLFVMANVEMNGSLKVTVNSIQYHLNLSTILESTDKRTIANFIHWNFISLVFEYTTDEAKNIINSIFGDFFGISEGPPRWRKCIREMEMKDASAFMFIEKYFDKSSVKAATEMMQNIKKGLEEQIENSNWISSESKKIMKMKINEMKTFLGYPDWYKNRTAVINHYRGLVIGNDYLDNVLSYKRYMKRRTIREFSGHKGNPEWRVNPTTLNAVYMMESNALYVSAADFQSPLFGSNVPNYVNYAIVGTIIGHEMSHGFDPQGVKYGLNDTKLMDEHMMKMYYQQSKCFVKQYDRYLGGKTLPPMIRDVLFGKTTAEPNSDESDNLESSLAQLTLGENMADTTGFQAVLTTYKNLKTNRELKLPGFEEYSDEQMFFISFAETYCEVMPQEWKEEMENAFVSHSSAMNRVNGAISNTKDFGELFNCPKGSPMNPHDQCNVWMKPGAALKIKSADNWRRRHHFHIVNW